MIFEIIIIVYFLGMVFFGTKLCCFCGDHTSHDLFSLTFWFIMYPYERFIKQDNQENKKCKA